MIQPASCTWGWVFPFSLACTVCVSTGAAGRAHPFLLQNVAGVSVERCHCTLVLALYFNLGTKFSKGALCPCEVAESFPSLDSGSRVPVPVLPFLHSVAGQVIISHSLPGGSCICKMELRRPALPHSASIQRVPAPLQAAQPHCHTIQGLCKPPVFGELV